MSRIERFSLVIFYKAKKKNHTRVFLYFYKKPVIFYKITVISFNLKNYVKYTMLFFNILIIIIDKG